MISFDFTVYDNRYANHIDLTEWAASIMNSRKPDFIIGDNYLHRWFVVPRNAWHNVYIHRTFRDDGDVRHDHPWDSTSIILQSGYSEDTPEGMFMRLPGDVVRREADQMHRLLLLKRSDGSSVPCTSLFITGPKVREWGFDCPGGWKHWKDFTGGKDNGRSTSQFGCGEN